MAMVWLGSGYGLAMVWLGSDYDLARVWLGSDYDLARARPPCQSILPLSNSTIYRHVYIYIVYVHIYIYVLVYIYIYKGLDKVWLGSGKGLARVCPGFG